jgi:hypothetical protein
MSKFTTIAYPAIALLSLAAAIGAHAQTASDDADRAGYGASYKVAAPMRAKSAAKPAANEIVIVGAKEVRSGVAFDAADRAGYGATPLTASLRTRADVRAEAIAAREAGWDVFTREGGDAQYAVVTRPIKTTADANRVMASGPAKAAQ